MYLCIRQYVITDIAYTIKGEMRYTNKELSNCNNADIFCTTSLGFIPGKSWNAYTKKELVTSKLFVDNPLFAIYSAIISIEGTNNTVANM